MSCSEGTGGGTPLIVPPYKIYAQCIWINTRIYQKNDIINVQNLDTWHTDDLDRGEMLIYKCVKSMTSEDVYPHSSEANRPPVANINYNASNEFWQQLNTSQLQDIITPKKWLWLYVTLILFSVLFLYIKFSS